MIALQTPLLRSDRRRCVLATVEDARRQLKDWDATEDTILELIEEGGLLAWNLALDPKSSARLWRILPESIAHFDSAGGSRPFGWLPARVLDRVLEGQHDQVLESTDLRLLLNCGPEHITNLIDAGHLKQLKGTDYRRGPGGAAKIPRPAVIRFLETRLEGQC